MKRISNAFAAHRAPAAGIFSSVLCRVATASLLLAAVGAAPAAPPANFPAQFAQGRVLVQPRAGVPLTELDNAVKPHGGRRTAVIKQINVHVIELPPQASPRAIAAALRKNPHVKFAEVDGALPLAFVPNDPQYGNAWHLPKIGAPTAWDSAQGTGVIIAILDTGVDTAHPDLKAQLVPGWNFYDGNDNVADVYGHGTAVAGSAAAAGNNGIGVSAVSFRSRIMPMRVTDTAGYGFYSLMASALTTAADNGARVANLSFLGVSLSSTVDSAAQYMRSKGGVVVIAGGNTGGLRTDPKSTAFTVVAATDSADARASFSSWGDYIDVAAPGVSIVTTTRGGGYGSFSGTSAASPVVAGVYGLMMSANPTLQPASLDNILFSTALDLGTAGFDQQFGYGRVQAASAVAKALQGPVSDTQPPTVAIASPATGKATGLVPVDVTATDNVGVARVELYVNGTLHATDTLSPYGFTLDSSKYQEGQQVTLQARAYDAAGNTASSSTVTLTVTNDTQPPTVAILNPASGSTVSGTVPVNVSATDDKQVAKIVLTIDGKEVAVAYGASLSYSWSATSTKGGKGGGKHQTTSSSTITARAYDAAGNAATATASVMKK